MPSIRPEPKLQVRKFHIPANLWRIHAFRHLSDMMPAFSLRVAPNSRLFAWNVKVRGPREGGMLGGKPFFKHGEKVLRMHLNATDKQHIVTLMRGLPSAIPELKKQGYVGVFGFSPSEPVIASLRKHLEAGGREVHSVDVPAKEARYELRRYRRNERVYGFPPLLKDARVTGVAARF